MGGGGKDKDWNLGTLGSITLCSVGCECGEGGEWRVESGDGKGYECGEGGEWRCGIHARGMVDVWAGEMHKCVLTGSLSLQSLSSQGG